jgi:iron complex outermembrane recepter protein
MKAKRTPIASAVALALMSAFTAAHAQDAAAPAAAAASAPQPAQAASAPVVADKPVETAAPGKNAQNLEAVTVTGIRGAMQKSLNVKRNADTNIEVISAEDIGKMPDKNVADSLQRIPGVNISSAGANEGGFDENDRVSMRGTNPSLTQTLINGHNVASGDWFVLNQAGSVGRSVSYTLMPSELVDRVVVHKSPEASLVEGGVAGSVDIITRKPLDFKKSFTAEASLGAVYAAQPKETDPQFSGLINFKNEANSFGLMVQAFSETRHLRRDGQELLGYEQIAPGSAVALSNPDLANVWYPTMIGSALFEQKRERRGGLIDAQMKLTNDFEVDLQGFLSTMKAANYNRNYLLWNTHFINKGAGQAPEPGYVIRNGTLVNATFAPVAGTTYGVYDMIDRPDAKADSKYVSLDTTYRASDALTFKTKAGVSRGNGETPTQNVAEFNTGIGQGASYGLNGKNNAADWMIGNSNAGPFPAAQPVSSFGWIFGDQNTHVKDKENWLQLDGEYAIEAGLLSALKFGGRYATHERSSSGVQGQGPRCADGSNFNWGAAPEAFFCTTVNPADPTGPQIANPGASPYNPANFPSGPYGFYPGNFAGGLGGNFPRNIGYMTPDQLAAYNATYGNRNPATREHWNSEFGLKETSSALYLQGNLEGKGWSGNIGLRVVRTQEEALNYVGTTAQDPNGIYSDFGNFTTVTVKNSYTDLLPSANLKLDLQKDLVARFGISRTMTRPDYSALAGAVSLSPPAVAGGEGSGSGSNPNLKPVRSTNLDASLQWYFAPRSLLSAGVFYMDLTNYIGYGRVTQNYLTFDSNNPQGAMVPYVLTVPVNSSGHVSGIELAYEQPVFTNFGVSANYTYADGKEAGGGPLVGTSRETYNLGAYFENDTFNARVSYNYRSAFFSGLDRATAFSQDAVSSVSASLGYRVNDNLSFTLDGQNLNNPTLRYYALNEDQPRSSYQSGRQYYLNARVKF